MLKSMTGYGRCEETVNGRHITAELKSVNRDASSPERESFISILRRDKKLPPRGSWRVSA